MKAATQSIFRTLGNSCLRRGSVRLALVVVLSAFAFLSGAVKPSYAGACGSLSNLQQYINAGAGGCTYKNLKFNNFSYDNTAGDLKIAAGDVTVGQDSIGDDYGLIFSANWSVGGTIEDTDSKIEYDVTVLGSNLLIGEFLLINGAMISCNCGSPPGDGSVSGTEDTGNLNLSTYVDRNTNDTSDGDTFAGVKSDFVTTEVYLQAGAFSSASLQSASNLFRLEAIPEPSTWMMVIAGFAGLGWTARRGSVGARLREV